jgi:hypothetical protein
MNLYNFSQSLTQSDIQHAKGVYLSSGSQNLNKIGNPVVENKRGRFGAGENRGLQVFPIDNPSL